MGVKRGGGENILLSIALLLRSNEAGTGGQDNGESGRGTHLEMDSI